MLALCACGLASSFLIESGALRELVNNMLMVAALILTCTAVVPPSRRWLGLGMHTPSPDEREQMIALQAAATTVKILTYTLGLAVIAVLAFAPSAYGLIYGLLSTLVALIWLPRLVERNLNSTM